MTPRDYRERLYERYSSVMGGADLSAQRRRPFWERLARELPDPSARVIELGAGRGDLLAYLREHGFQHLSGIDGSLEQVRLAEAQNIPVKLGDAASVLEQMPDASVDAVIAIDVLEHLRKHEVFDTLDHCIRVLSSGGRLIIHTVNGESPFFGAVRFGDFTHESTFTKSSMTQILKTVGFREVRCSEDRPIVHGVASALRAVAWELARTTAIIILAAETGALDRGRILSQNFLTIAIK